MEVDDKKENEKLNTTANGEPKDSELIRAAKLLEDEEEFDEFPFCDKGDSVDTGEATAPEINVWEDNWDDETLETDFHKQLEEELKKGGFKTN